MAGDTEEEEIFGEVRKKETPKAQLYKAFFGAFNIRRQLTERILIGLP